MARLLGEQQQGRRSHVAAAASATATAPAPAPVERAAEGAAERALLAEAGEAPRVSAGVGSTPTRSALAVVGTVVVLLVVVVVGVHVRSPEEWGRCGVAGARRVGDV
ncbi:hypothetical protein GCM10009710_02930 [Aeromicrobium alkaliterrae]|uniref:Uncharacterized protein n=1 Tax=Aeromicrobium alkaliterrae TaxID=302168 RepID=A0ABP4VM02_9ACTN